MQKDWDLVTGRPLPLGKIERIENAQHVNLPILSEFNTTASLLIEIREPCN